MKETLEQDFVDAFRPGKRFAWVMTADDPLDKQP
jgi:hypothetical protein